MADPGFVKNFNAGADISAYTLVKFGTADTTVIHAAAAADSIIGVAQHLDAASGYPVDVILDGVANVKAGGTITRGDLVTSDANGKGVAAAPAAGANARYVGVAMASAVDGDVFPVLVCPGSIQGA